MSATRIRPSEVRQAQRFATPERSLQQRLDALAAANAIRVFRAAWKREVVVGEREILEPLDTIAKAEGAETLWDSMKVIDYLLGIPKVGRVKARKWLDQTRISPSKTLGGMSARQRGELEGVIRSWSGFHERHAAAYYRALVRGIAGGGR